MDRRELADDFGRPFWVIVDDEDASQPIFSVRREQFPIGHVMIRAYYSTWHISDLVIERETSERLWLGPLPLPRTKKYENRDRGIGSKVMRLVIEEAAKRHIVQITGDIVPEKPGEAKRLKQFYERLGFRIGHPQPHAPEGAVATFVMDVEAVR